MMGPVTSTSSGANVLRDNGQISAATHQHVFADLTQLLLNRFTVLTSHCLLPFAAVNLLLNAGNDTPRRSSSTDDVLVCNRQQVPFFIRQLFLERSHLTINFYKVGTTAVSWALLVTMQNCQPTLLVLSKQLSYVIVLQNDKRTVQNEIKKFK